MKTSLPSRDERDPVGFAIEKYLHLVGKDGAHRLSVEKDRAGVHVCFELHSAHGVDLDTALIRLGALLLGNPAFRDELTKALRGPVAVEQARHPRLGRFGEGALRPE